MMIKYIKLLLINFPSTFNSNFTSLKYSSVKFLTPATRHFPACQFHKRSNSRIDARNEYFLRVIRVIHGLIYLTDPR